MSTMPTSICWDNDDHTIIRFTLGQRWRWSDVRAAKEQIDLMMSTVDHKVHLIASNEHTNWMPGDFNRNVLGLIHDIHPNMGSLVVVCNNSLFEQLFRLFATMNGGMPFDFIFTQTIEAAREALMERAAA
jgi:hypothetical protein